MLIWPMSHFHAGTAPCQRHQGLICRSMPRVRPHPPHQADDALTQVHGQDAAAAGGGTGGPAGTTSAALRRRIAFRISEATMTDSATASAGEPLREVEAGRLEEAPSNGPKTVNRMSVRTDTPVETANVLSQKVSRLKTVRRSFVVAIEKATA